MPYVFVTSIFPPHTTDQLAQIYVDTLKDVRSKLRATGKEIIANAIKATIEGIEVIGVWDIKERRPTFICFFTTFTISWKKTHPIQLLLVNLCPQSI